MLVKTFTALELVKPYKGTVAYVNDMKVLWNQYNGKYVRLCMVDDCVNRNASGGVCAKHRGYKNCIIPECGKIATFAPLGNKALRCGKHKEPGDVNVRQAECENPQCHNRASFGPPGGKIMRCRDHKIQGDVNRGHGKCEHPDCNKQPMMGQPGGKRLRCGDHKKPGDINLGKAICEVPDCNKQSGYAPMGDKPLRCFQHKMEGDVNVASVTCRVEGCTKSRTFGQPSESAQRCGKHRIAGDVDKSHIKCRHPGCDIIPHYGRLFERFIHCARHRTNSDFYNIRPKCIVPGCIDRPYFTHDTNSGYPIRCETHKLSTDIDVVQRPCSKCGLSYYIPSDRDQCNDCWDFFVKKFNRMKEDEIHQLFLSTDIASIFKIVSHDRIIDEGCSKYRPDVILSRAGYYIVVEIDEHQHVSYPKECENTCMKQIYHDLGGAEVLFVRYNPDSYVDSTGVKDPVNNEARHIYLVGLLRLYSSIDSLGYPLGVTHLFYDGFDINRPSVLVALDPYEVSSGTHTPSDYQTLELVPETDDALVPGE